jgi:hypothetical protein
VSDRLDHLLQTAGPLLHRVDAVLTAGGAPADHPVWAHLRRVRLLPWDAVQAVAALRPGDLAGAGPELRADARSYAGIAAALPPPGPWTGDAADAYESARRRTAAHLSGGPDSLDERLSATADLADALTAWMTGTRQALAVVLAEVLSSAEGLSLSVHADDDPPPARDVAAAAEVAARILAAVAESYDEALDIVHGTADLAVALPA